MMRANLLPQRTATLAFAGLRLQRDDVVAILLGIAVVIVIGLLGVGIETLRAHRYSAAADEAERLVAERAPERERARRLALDTARFQEIDRTAAALRSSGMAAAFAIAQIGNAIPRSAWLESLSSSDAGFEVTGNTETVDTIGATLVAFGKALPEQRTMLVSIDGKNAAEEGVRFTARIAAPATGGAR